MDHGVPLISTIAVSFVLAFCLAFLAHKARLPPLVGYLLAGVVIGPFTPGFVADAGLAGQLAEVGVILLMFGVGLHFSPADLIAVRGIAIPGALAVIALVTAAGAALGVLWGWSLAGAVVFGLCLSVASTVVLLRALEERNALSTTAGRVAVGWLVVEDMAMVLVLVLLPPVAALAGPQAGPSSGLPSLLVPVGMTMLKVGTFVAIALMIGPRVVPWLLKQVARTGSRELFTLSVLALALGLAYGSAELFGVSFALGAFFAGVVLSESRFGHRAAAESIPMQDAFAVLFFVSVGMVFDPGILVRQPLSVAAVLALVVIGKAVLAAGVTLLLGYPVSIALPMAAALSRIGEFSFILGALGMQTGVLPGEAKDLVVAAALLSMTLGPLVFVCIDRITPRLRAWAPLRGHGQHRLSQLQSDLDDVRRSTEAREAERKLEVRTILELFPVFGDLDHHATEDLLLLFHPAVAQPGDRVLRKGDRATAAYFISSGSVQVSAAGREIVLGPGDFFGEMALLSGARRNANVTAIDYCQFFTVTRRDFVSFLARHPSLRERIDDIVAQRRAMNRA
ncbi:cation:proton antiporter [Alsobacter sp. SYSU M60028]|uniref:Cation:proton antiporter n=1 Tax=Alsobacter ponti TaxID=2962936 RepID=A0ABT1LID2_9HYPH|nr:cation:proton antiporter [Alsobacter ponti]MCP8940888.1 cation:proton antiporter [Alsobacter ponti]